MKYPKCNDSRKCFAKFLLKGEYVCDILESEYKIDGECPFCKAKRATKKYDRNKRKN